jgi:hypothetical protein
MSTKPTNNRQSPDSPGFVESARERAIEAYDNVLDRATAASARAGEMPLLALAGGVALGALLAALLPRTRTEEKLLGPVGGKITDGARAAADAAKEAGREKLTELNITRDAGANAVQSLVDGLTEAAKVSGQAALGAVRKQD